MKRPDGVTIIAVYEFLSAIPSVLGICGILGFAVPGTIAGPEGSIGVAEVTVSLFILGIVVLLIGAGALLSVITGWGLLGMKGWARTMAGYRAGCSFSASFPHRHHHWRADHLVSAQGRSQASFRSCGLVPPFSGGS